MTDLLIEKLEKDLENLWVNTPLGATFKEVIDALRTLKWELQQKQEHIECLKEDIESLEDDSAGLEDQLCDIRATLGENG